MVREEGSGTRSYQDQLFASLNIQPKTITLSSTQAVKSSVANGIGITLLSHHTVEEELKTGSLKLINKEETELTRYFHLLHRMLSSIQKAHVPCWIFLMKTV
ncbi:LysR substrate-binding domain-containing protein [Salinicoccus halodurans]|uniref:LysR substrate-binding domain-containing protein n=1 Tax=Salinicoccus halodurans TaxID=407035 RepID=UPI0022862880|nr:LysR substrate-binding domain-containing protein [Salinicoccus halodurans]